MDFTLNFIFADTAGVKRLKEETENVEWRIEVAGCKMGGWR